MTSKFIRKRCQVQTFGFEVDAIMKIWEGCAVQFSIILAILQSKVSNNFAGICLNRVMRDT